MKFVNTENFWLEVARAPLAFGAPRSVEIIDPEYTFAGMTKWFGKADLMGIIFCVAFSGQRQHAKRLVSAIKSHLRNLASTHDEFAVTVLDNNWELSDGNTRALLYKALLLKKMGILTGDVPVSYSFDDLPKKVRVSFTKTTSAAESLQVYNQYNSKEAVKTTRDAVHTALKMTAGEFGLTLQSEFFRNEGAIVTASEYAFFPSRVKPEVAVKVLQPILPILDQMGLTRKPGLATSLPGGAVAALAVLAGINASMALTFAKIVTSGTVDASAEKLTLPELFVRRVQEFKSRHLFSSAAALRPTVAELVGLVVAYAQLEDSNTQVDMDFSRSITVSELMAIAEKAHPLLDIIFKRRDSLLKLERNKSAQGSLCLDSEAAPSGTGDTTGVTTVDTPDDTEVTA